MNSQNVSSGSGNLILQAYTHVVQIRSMKACYTTEQHRRFSKPYEAKILTLYWLEGKKVYVPFVSSPLMCSSGQPLMYSSDQ